MTTLGVVVTLNLILQTVYYAMDRKREREKASEKIEKDMKDKTETSEKTETK